MATVPELISGDSGNCPIPQALTVLSIGPSLGQLLQATTHSTPSTQTMEPEWGQTHRSLNGGGQNPKANLDKLAFLCPPSFLSPLGPTHLGKETRKGTEQKGQKRGKEVPTP